jgi:dienelactone hydrolase
VGFTNSVGLGGFSRFINSIRGVGFVGRTGESISRDRLWDGVKDLNAAVGFLRGRPDVEANRIGGIGLSVGGELLLQAAAESDALNAVVSEGAGIRSIREALEASAPEIWLAVAGIFVPAVGPRLGHGESCRV